MDELNVGSRLRAIRKARNLSLEQASALCHVSRPMLGQIERGTSSPTIATLWKIAGGLKVPFSSFLGSAPASYQVSRPDQETMIAEEEGRMRAWPLFEYDPNSSMETFMIEFDPGCIRASEPHQSGVREDVFVAQGELWMVIGNEEIHLRENEAIRFQADCLHRYENRSEKPARIQNTIFYSES